MRKVHGLLCFCLALSLSLYAQDKKVGKATLSSYDFEKLTVNDLLCYVQNNGNIGSNPLTGNEGLYYPGGQDTLSLLYASGLWLAGKQAGQLRAACMIYDLGYQPGQILPSGDASDPTLVPIYSYKKGDIIDPEAIDLGCPSEVMGDQMAFFVCNDMCSYFNLPPIGVEAQVAVFAYKGPAELARTLFIRYRLVNKNPDGLTLDSAYVGYWLDADIGYSRDDAMGSDTLRQMVYAYNGDADDEGHYGQGAPALGCCLLQGPLVPAPGKTARLIGGRVAPDSDVLGTRGSFFYPYYSGWIGPRDDESGATEAYNLLQGLSPNGVQWDIYSDVRYPFPGDPVTGTGWNYLGYAFPDDIRMGISSGPFTLACGDTQEVWYALMVGDGKLYGGEDVASSIMALRKAHEQVDYVGSHDFEVATEPETLICEAVVGESEIIGLAWDAVSEAYDHYGYAFEGYNVWMSGDPEEEAPTLIATFDVENGVTEIEDEVYDDEMAVWINQSVQHGTDSGLSHEIRLSEIPVTGEPIVNYRDYYLGVSAYVYNPEGVPKVLESEIAWSRVTAQPPLLDSAARLDEITVFPNPYFGYQRDESSSYDQYVTVGSLPGEDCTLRVFTLSGALVKVIQHDNGTPYERISLLNEGGLQMASGMYLIHVETAYGHRVLKWGLVNRVLGYYPE